MEQPRPRLRLVVAALCVLAVLFACSTPTTVRLSTAPADKLALTLTITHLLTPSAQVIVDAVLRSSSGNPVELTGKQHLTVNGRNEDSSPVGGFWAKVRPDSRCRAHQREENTPSSTPTSVVSKPASSCRHPSATSRLPRQPHTRG
jgi:hypothetical protein